MINSFSTKAVRLSSESKLYAFNQKRNKKLLTDQIENATIYAKSVTSDLVKQSDDTNNYQCDISMISKYIHIKLPY